MPVPDCGVLREVGDEKNLELWIDDARGVRDLSSVKAVRQSAVGDQEVDASTGLDHPETGRSVCRLEHPVSDLGKYFADHHQDSGFVVDDQHRIAVTAVERGDFGTILIRELGHEPQEI